MTKRNGSDYVFSDLDMDTQTALAAVFKEATSTVGDEVIDVEHAIMDILLDLPADQRLTVLVRVMSVLVSRIGH